jgi:hypothetical protein
MLTALPAVVEDVGVCAAGFFQGVGENRETIEGAVGIDGLGESDKLGGLPVVRDCGRSKRLGEDVP